MVGERRFWVLEIFGEEERRGGCAVFGVWSFIVGMADLHKPG